MAGSDDKITKQKRGAALIGELLMQLGQRGSFLTKMAELEERLGTSAVSRLLDEVERTMDALGLATPSPPPAIPRPEQRPLESGETNAAPEPVKEERQKREKLVSNPIVLPSAPAKALPLEDLPKLPADPFADLLASLNLAVAETPATRTKKEPAYSGENPTVPKKETVVAASDLHAEKDRPATIVEKEKKEEEISSPAVLNAQPLNPPAGEHPPIQAAIAEPKDPEESSIPVAEPEREKREQTVVKEKPPVSPPPAPAKPAAKNTPSAQSDSPLPDKKSLPSKVPVIAEKPAEGVSVRKPVPLVPSIKPDSAPPSAKQPLKPSVVLPKSVPVRRPYPLDEQDIVYFHGVAQIPVEEKPAAEPFFMDERGIENKESVFAMDRGGLRFYVSRISSRSMNVSKNGVLLLNKQESIHLRGTHFAILNHLRAYGVLLPFEFGLVAQGVEDLHGKIDDHMYEIRDALEELLATKWWEVTVNAYDAKMAPMVAPEPSQQIRRERDRRGDIERGVGSSSRIDIKMLERVLNKQKSLAEEIHRKLEGIAGRADVDMMVSLSSGSSEDWKPILRASYELSFPEIYKFSNALTDLQINHLKYQLMFVLKGDREDYSFQGQ
jgi:hypothetical protein